MQTVSHTNTIFSVVGSMGTLTWAHDIKNFYVGVPRSELKPTRMNSG